MSHPSKSTDDILRQMVDKGLGNDLAISLQYTTGFGCLREESVVIAQIELKDGQRFLIQVTRLK